MPTITIQVYEGTDDAHQYGGPGTVDATGNVLNASATNQWVGLAFVDGLFNGALKTATITEAHLELYFTSGSFDDPDVTIYGHKDLNPYGEFSGFNSEISVLASTTATVNWTASNVGTGWVSSPDIKSIIREVIDQFGFTSATLCIIYKGNSASPMRVRSYEGNSAQAAKLVITYEIAATGQPMAARGRQVPGMRRPHGSQGW